MGDAEAVKSLNDCEDIPAEVLRDHPHIETFSKVFAAFLPGTSAPPPPPAPSKRILEGIDNVMPSAHPTHHPSDGANATARGYVILGGTTHGQRRPLDDGHQRRARRRPGGARSHGPGLALARLCPTDRWTSSWRAWTGGVECTIRVQTVAVRDTNGGVYIRGPPPVKVRSAMDGVARKAPSSSSARPPWGAVVLRLLGGCRHAVVVVLYFVGEHAMDGVGVTRRSAKLRGHVAAIDGVPGVRPGHAGAA